MHDHHDRIAFRVQTLAVVEVTILLLVLIISILAFPNLRTTVMLFCIIGGLVAGLTFWLRRSPVIEPIIYGNTVVMLALLAAIDPLSGTLSGSTWTLYQIWPLVAALVLRKTRSTIIVMLAAAGTLITVATLQISGTIPVQLSVPPEILWFNLSIQILVIIALASTSGIITAQEQRAYATALQLGIAREQQLTENQRILDQQAALNQELRASLEQVQQRDQQLREEQARSQDLLRTVDALAAPLIPISDDVVVAPLVGSFNQSRLAALAGDLLQQVGQRQVRVLIIDVTGLSSFDTATAQALLATIESCRLMGTSTMLVGVQPEMAQTIVGLGIDLQHIATRANLQEAIRYAMSRVMVLAKS